MVYVSPPQVSLLFKSGGADGNAGFNTEHFWLEYPHRKMTFHLKTYYLLQAAYWLQQTIIMIAKIEKPRKDYKELVAHVSPFVDLLLRVNNK